MLSMLEAAVYRGRNSDISARRRGSGASVDLSVTKTHNAACSGTNGHHWAIFVMSEIFIYQILPHYAKSEDLDPGFLVLDNRRTNGSIGTNIGRSGSSCSASRWMREAFYGFLSPRFNQKTDLSAAAVRNIVSRESNTADIVLFSHSLEKTAYHWNVFEYGEFCHPGLLDLATQFFTRIGQPTDLKQLVTHSRNEVYSNYMIAKPRFWKAWLGITEQLIAIAESPADPLGAELRSRPRTGVSATRR